MHFICTVCEKDLSVNMQYIDWDLKPICGKCYEAIPFDIKRKIDKWRKFAMKSQ